MANFICVVDPDVARRQRFAEQVRPLTPPVPGLMSGELALGAFHALWSCGPRAPLSTAKTEDHIALIWGRALPADREQAITAENVAAAWLAPGDGPPDAWDGYYAALAYGTREGLTLGGDILGMFPLYWWASGDVVLCGSSPELFRHHPACSPQLDTMGLVGLLLTMHSVGGRTLVQGVRRLAPGRLFRATSGTDAREVVQYTIPLSDRYYDMPFAEHVHLLEEGIDAAVRRQSPGGMPYAMLLSGGLDSRTLAGFLGRQGVAVSALTFGKDGDIEMQCARAVARAMHFEHRAADVDLADAEFCADRHARWLHLMSGFNSIEYWNALPHLARLPEAFIGGYNFDVVVGPYIAGHPYSPTNHSMSFDNFLPAALSWGVPPDLLRRMLREPELQAMVDAVIGELRATYEGYHHLESKRCWTFRLLHRQRFHVSQIPWIFSFASWPALPVLDRRLLDVAAGMSPAAVGERMAQKELVISRFPRLAALPLDRNSLNRLPLAPNWHDLFVQWARLKVRPVTQKLPIHGRERRYYHRVYDFNSRGWRQVRRYAEPHRSRWDDLLDARVLGDFLPPPEAEFHTTDVFGESSGRKLMCGLLLWARDHR